MIEVLDVILTGVECVSDGMDTILEFSNPWGNLLPALAVTLEQVGLSGPGWISHHEGGVQSETNMGTGL
jgi:hypothetical protein